MAYQELKIEEIFEKKHGKDLYANLAIPSTIHSYSLCIQYIKEWFVSKFNKDYFKTVHIDGKHVFDDYRRLNKLSMLKNEKPALAILPQLDFEFNRDGLDSTMYGIDMYIKRSKYEQAFFKDIPNSSYLSLTMEALQMNFTFRLKLSTRAQQVDMYKFMKMAFRVGYTQGHDVDMDYHVPYNIMLMLAKDNGFKIENNKVVDVINFLRYLNSHSELAFTYKLRCINGNNEFFIRLDRLYVHISTPEISADDGEREGQLYNNYIIDMNAIVRFPCPKFYIYHSENEKDDIKINTIPMDENCMISIYTIKLATIPLINEKGWNQYVTTDYEEENLNDPLVIDFKSLFMESDLGTVIEYNKSIYISNAIFLDIKIYNNGEEIEKDIDWENLILTTKEPVSDIITNIAVYMDIGYTNNVLANLKDIEENRIEEDRQ